MLSLWLVSANCASHSSFLFNSHKFTHFLLLKNQTHRSSQCSIHDSQCSSSDTMTCCQWTLRTVQSYKENHSKKYLELWQSYMSEWLNNNSMNQTRFNESKWIQWIRMNSRNQKRSFANQWKQIFKRQTAYRSLMHSENNDNTSTSCQWSVCETELRFSTWIFSLQRRFALIDLDRDWIES